MKMRRIVATCLAIGLIASLTGCGGQDPNVRRGDMFYKNGKYDDAAKAYETAIAKNKELMKDDAFREKFKNAYFYYGGQIEMSGSLDGAIKYYVKGFDIQPTDVGICDKLAKYFWEGEEFGEAAKYFKYLVEFDSNEPDTDKKWQQLHQDYYALGYALFQAKQYEEAKEALEQSIKAVKKGPKTKQAKSALAAVKQKLKKK